LIKSFNAPIYNAIKGHIEKKPVSFHVPGHRMGRGIPAGISKNLARFDMTEISGLDNLHYPNGIIKEAQELAAQAFGADKTYFLVNGSSSGIHSVIMTVCGKGDTIIAARDCHRSVIAGMMLAGAEPVFVSPLFSNEYCITAGIDIGALEEVLRENREAKGVLITRPSYYGVCQDIKKVAQIVHSYGMILIVDEAHGAHLGFYEALPESALQQGADVSIQSAHKTLAVMTQGAYLHVRTGRIDTDRLEFNLRLLQTTSPSYVIMMLLDIARCIMKEEGCAQLKKLVNRVNCFRADIKQFKCIRALEEGEIKGVELDTTRIVINTEAANMTGFEAENALRKKNVIFAEMADKYNIVCVCSVANSGRDFTALYRGIEELEKAAPKTGGDGYLDKSLQSRRGSVFSVLPRRGVELKDIMKLKPLHMELSRSAGKICMDIITPYPPGVPVLCPGEIISDELVEYIYDIIKSGAVVNGVSKDCKVTAAEP
jgi:arginine/lysine/ornithine decarboxylase